MGRCIHHPDEETDYICLKDSLYLCGQCLKCRNPKLYCKFRESCTIWFLEREEQKNEKGAGE